MAIMEEASRVIKPIEIIEEVSACYSELGDNLSQLEELLLPLMLPQKTEEEKSVKDVEEIKDKRSLVCARLLGLVEQAWKLGLRVNLIMEALDL